MVASNQIQRLAPLITRLASLHVGPNRCLQRKESVRLFRCDLRCGTVTNLLCTNVLSEDWKKHACTERASSAEQYCHNNWSLLSSGPEPLVGCLAVHAS